MKKFLTLILVVTVCLSLSSCSQDTTANSSPTVKLPSITEPSFTVESSLIVEPEKPIYPESINKGDTLVISNEFEVQLKSQDFTTIVKPPKADGFYTYYEVKDNNKIYHHTVFEVKNLKSSYLRSDRVFDILLLYDGKYEYTGFSTIEKDGGSEFTYTNISGIDPLVTRRIHFLTEVPLEVSNSGKKVELFIIINNEKILCTNEVGENHILVEDDSKSEIKENTSYKNFTELKIGETVTDVDYVEMTVKKAEFTSTVKSSKASSYYSYYEVKETNKVYAHLLVAFKNLKTTGLNADEVANVELIYDNRYFYTGFSTIEKDGGSDLTYTNITRIDPLDIGVIHYIIEVPNEVQESGKEVVFTINLNNEQYYLTLVP